MKLQQQVLGLMLVVGLFSGVGCGPHRIIDVGDQRLPPRDKGGEPGAIISKRPVLIHFKEDKHDFDAYFGADFKKDGYVQAQVKNSFSQLVLTHGWVYLVGSYPFAQTERVYTFASGTTYAIQNDGDVQRVYTLDAPRTGYVTIELLPGLTPAAGSPTRLVIPKLQYATITPDETGGAFMIRGPFPIKGDATVLPFITDLQTQVNNANLPGWPAGLP